MFGMGTGITSPLWPPGNKKQNKDLKLKISFKCTKKENEEESYLYYLCIEKRNNNMVKPHDLLVLVG